MLSMTTSGWVKSTSTCAPPSATLNSQSPASTAATRSMSSAATTAWQTCCPMRPRAPRTPIRVGSVTVLSLRSDGAVEGMVVKRAHHRQAAWLVQKVRGHVRDVLAGDRIDVVDQVVDAENVAVGQLALADPGHPRARVLETEHDASAHLALASLDLSFGDRAVGDVVELGPNQVEHLLGLARLAPGVHAEQPGIGIARAERVDRVRQAALLADALEQPRAHPAAERGRHHAEGPAPLVVPGDASHADHHIGLLGVVADDLDRLHRRRGPEPAAPGR